MTRLVLADDDPIVRTSLKTILTAAADMEVAAMGTSAKEAVDLYFKHCPDLILLDIRMGDGSGIDAAKEILARDKAAKILFLTTFNDEEYIAKAIALGAGGYLLKQDFEKLAPAIKGVLSGHRVFGSQVIDRLADRPTFKDFSDYDLSEREVELIALVADGKNNHEIAETLFLGEGTVRNYLSRILEKLELRDRTQLAVFYYKH